MPTYEWQSRFTRDLQSLSDDEQEVFRSAVREFVADLRGGRFRKGLRVKTVQAAPGVWEMTWADDGRANFSYGARRRPGEPHVIWRRVGTHKIFDAP